MSVTHATDGDGTTLIEGGGRKIVPEPPLGMTSSSKTGCVI